MSKPIMYHVVAGYPDEAACLELMLAMQAAGAAAIEVQIPFSDPIADGETIMQANDAALVGGMTTAGSFELIEKARQQGLETDLYLMSYLQKVRHFGLAEFCQRVAQCQAIGLIVPDLPYDSPEAADLRKLATKHDLAVVPVLSPGMSEDRLHDILAQKPSVLYITTTQGITGNQYTPAAQLKQLVAEIKQKSDAKLMIGFGIATPADVADALSIGDVAVIGSAVIKKIQADGVPAAVDYMKTLAK